MNKGIDYMRPKNAYNYAKGYGPSDETRQIVCKNPKYAYYYAENVDKCPRDDTRKAACKASQYAYFYARDIDGCPR